MEGYRWASGEVTRRFCILTTTSNQDIQHVHDRMSVILKQTDSPLWLNAESNEAVRGSSFRFRFPMFVSRFSLEA